MLKERKIGLVALALIVIMIIALPFFRPGLAAGEMAEGEKQQGTSSFPARDLQLPQAPQPVVCDYFLQNGLIIDGSGGEPYYGNVAIKGDSIVDIGYCLPAPGATVIDLSGRVVCPGFIDLHTHTEGYWLADRGGDIVLRQGVTTQIVGNCGTSTDNVSQFLQNVDGSAINIGTYMGYKALRRLYIGDSLSVTPEITAKMAEQLKASIKNGAFGLSLGLSYYPQNKATFSELLTLSKATKEAGGLLSVHIRDEYDGVVASVQEAIDLAKQSGVPLEYSHIKAAGKDNWPKQDQILAMIAEADLEGVDIRGDVYGYTYSSWDVAGKDASLSEENVRKVLKDPLVMIGSDSGLGSSGIASHPRAYANASRILAYYVRDEQVIELEEAVMKMTSMPASRLGITDRGLLKKGMKADIAAFYLANIKENASRFKPNQLSDGISYLFVNGQLAINAGLVTGVKAGQALKRTNPIGQDQ